MELSELKQKTTSGLDTLLMEHRALVRELEFQAREGQLREVHKLKEAKKTIARILTLRNQEHADQSST